MEVNDTNLRQIEEVLIMEDIIFKRFTIRPSEYGWDRTSDDGITGCIPEIKPCQGMLTITDKGIKIEKMSGSSPDAIDLLGFILADKDIRYRALLERSKRCHKGFIYHYHTRVGMSGCVTHLIDKSVRYTNVKWYTKQVWYETCVAKAYMEGPINLTYEDLMILITLANGGSLGNYLEGVIENPKMIRKRCGAKYTKTVIMDPDDEDDEGTFIIIN